MFLIIYIIIIVIKFSLVYIVNYFFLYVVFNDGKVIEYILIGYLYIKGSL